MHRHGFRKFRKFQNLCSKYQIFMQLNIITFETSPIAFFSIFIFHQCNYVYLSAHLSSFCFCFVLSPFLSPLLVSDACAHGEFPWGGSAD